MAQGAELEVIMEMEWKPMMSKDFSLVAWSTGSLDIVADTLSTVQSVMPFTAPRSSDHNNSSVNTGACDTNPA
jgi:hypothetical protein